MPDTQELVQRAAAGDHAAETELLRRHRQRLKRMVMVRLDRRLARRVDPSDIVQETLFQAARGLSEYLRSQPLPFYPWIRQLAIEQVAHQHRRHVKALGRSVKREAVHAGHLPDHSAIELAVRLLADNTSPSDHAARRELRTKVRRVLDELDPQDREVLVLRFLEQLSTTDTAEVLALTVAAVKSRQRRALERFSRFFEEHSS
jgi:RNA polymerase sigma-70 factor (ECF subfamily)